MGFKNERKIVKPKVLESFGIKLFMAWIKKPRLSKAQLTMSKSIISHASFCVCILYAYLLAY